MKWHYKILNILHRTKERLLSDYFDLEKIKVLPAELTGFKTQLLQYYKKKIIIIKKN